ncbi:MAG: hypothetical protein QW609_03990 [Candidatus Aenigmatarchaeota archaeon]
MRCEYQECNEKACVYLESVNCSYCEYHFKQVAYDILGKKKLLAIIGKKKLKVWQKILGIVS